MHSHAKLSSAAGLDRDAHAASGGARWLIPLAIGAVVLTGASQAEFVVTLVRIFVRYCCSTS